MKMNRKILVFSVILVLLFTACSQKTKMTKLEDEINTESGKKGGNSNSSQEGDGEPDSDVTEENEGIVGNGKDSGGYQAEKIDMREVSGDILYDPHEGKMTCITTETSNDDQLIYSVKVLNDERRWIDGGKSWVVESGTLSQFVYGVDGELYALDEKLEEDGKGNFTRTYTLYKYLKDKDMEAVPLENLNEPMKTKFMENLDLKEEEGKESVFIISIKALEDGTMAVFYSNMSMRVYDLDTGKELRSIEVEAPWDSIVVTRDEIITMNEKPEKDDAVLDVIDANTGEITRNITYGSGVYERGSANWVMLCKGTDNDFYLLAGGEGIFSGDMDCTEMDLLIDQSILGDPPALGYQYFAKGKEDDFYITYYVEGKNADVAPQDAVAELQMLHIY